MFSMEMYVLDENNEDWKAQGITKNCSLKNYDSANTIKTINLS